jgi:arabinose-5-phosphate isomerase
MDKLLEGKRVFDTEIKALEIMRDSLDETFVKILDIITGCKGKVVITGMGKPGHIGTKIAATLASLGTPSFYLHPGEAMHGDLGMITGEDIVIAISYSGESDEIVQILPNVKWKGTKLIGITGNADSTLAKASDVVQILPKFKEAGNYGLAPTSSTTVELCYGDALAVVASEVYGYTDVDFGKNHPAGSLGKKLILKVVDLMAKNEKNAVISDKAMLKVAIVELSKKGLGAVELINERGELSGLITDGDLRRQLEKGADVYNLHAADVMTTNPMTITSGKLAIEALTTMRDYNISCLPVVDDNKVVGTIRVQDILAAGIVG